MAVLNRIGWIRGARSYWRSTGMALATSTDFPTMSAAAVARAKLPKVTKYWERMRFVVSTIKLKPMKKKMVGGRTSRSSWIAQILIRDASPADEREDFTETSNF